MGNEPMMFCAEAMAAGHECERFPTLGSIVKPIHKFSVLILRQRQRQTAGHSSNSL